MSLINVNANQFAIDILSAKHKSLRNLEFHFFRKTLAKKDALKIPHSNFLPLGFHSAVLLAFQSCSLQRLSVLHIALQV